MANLYDEALRRSAQAPGGAVFGMYPSAAGTSLSSHATDSRLRSGYTGDGASADLTRMPSAQRGLPAGVKPSTAGGGRGVVNPPSIGAAESPLPPPAAPPMPSLPSVGGSVASADAGTAPPTAPRTFAEVIRQGSSYSGSANISGDVSINGQAPRNGGMVSTQNMAAADNLAGSQQQASTGRTLAQAAMAGTPGVATPTVLNSTNDWAARNNLRNAAVSASSIENTRRWGGKGAENNPAMQEYRATLATDQALQQAQPTLAQAAMRENAGIQREGMQQQGATGRTMVQALQEQERLKQSGETQRIANRGKTMVQALQEQIATEQDAGRRGSIVQRLRELQGQAQPAEWGVQVTPTTKNVDGSTSMGSIVRYNKATGQTEVVGQGGGGITVSTPQQLAALPSGSVYTGPDGKQYRKN